MDLKITPVDKNAEQEGVWRTYRGVDLLIARGNNIAFKSAFRKLTKPFQREIERNIISERDSENILAEALADGVLLDWKNFVINNKEVPYTKQNAKQLLINDPDCRDFVQEVANDLDNYIIEQKQDLKGN